MAQTSFPVPEGYYAFAKRDRLRELKRLFQAGDKAAARKVAAEIEKIAGTSPAAWEILGYYYLADNNTHPAIKAYEKALSLRGLRRQSGYDTERICKALLKVYQEKGEIVKAYNIARITTESSMSYQTKYSAELTVRKLQVKVAEMKRQKIAAEVRGLHAVPVPGEVKIDGKLDDWDLSGQALACNDVGLNLDIYSARIAMMYDDKHLYFAFRVTDWSPLRSRANPATLAERTWGGDGVRIRFRMKDKLSSLDCWYYRPGAVHAVHRQHGLLGGVPVGQQPIRVYSGVDADLKDGIAQAFTRDTESPGYIQELRVPWSVITALPAPKANKKIGILFEFLWGTYRTDHRVVANVARNRTIRDKLWMKEKNFGPVTLEPKGNIKLPKPAWLIMKEQILDEVWSQEAHRQSARDAVFLDGGKALASAGQHGKIRLWAAAGGRETKVFDSGHGSVYALTAAGKGRLASAGSDGKIRIWSVSDQKLQRELKGHSKTVWDLAVSADGKLLASGSLDGTVRVWDLSSGRETVTLRRPNGIRAVAFAPDGKSLAAGDLRGKIALWSLPDGKLLNERAAHRYGVRCLAFSPDGKNIISGADDMLTIVWDQQAGKAIHRLTGHASLVTSLEMFPGGKRLATGALDGSVRVWDLQQGKQIFFRETNDAGVWSVSPSPDGKFLAVAGRDGIVRMIKAEK